MPANSNSGTTRLPDLPSSGDDPKAALLMIERWAKETVAPYIRYTPEITGTSGGFAYGAGAYQLGRWKRAGSRTNVEILIYFGNPGFVSGGATSWHISLPILPILSDLPTAWNNKLIGEVYLNSAILQFFHAALANRAGIGGPVNRDFIIPISGGPPGALVTGTVSGPATAWAQGALLMANLSYESAP